MQVIVHKHWRHSSPLQVLLLLQWHRPKNCALRSKTACNLCNWARTSAVEEQMLLLQPQADPRCPGGISSSDTNDRLAQEPAARSGRSVLHPTTLPPRQWQLESTHTFDAVTHVADHFLMKNRSLIDKPLLKKTPFSLQRIVRQQDKNQLAHPGYAENPLGNSPN